MPRDLAGFAASAGPHRAASGGAPVRNNPRRSRSVRDRSRGKRSPDGRTARTQTDGQTLHRSARHRSCGVDERRPRQDTSPACVLPGTVWGAASGQNCQVQLDAVLAAILAGARQVAEALRRG